MQLKLIPVLKQLDYHKRFFYKNSIYKEPLAKALGIKKGESRPLVIDATAGTLHDSLLIYSFGAKVVAIERHPLVASNILSSLADIGLEGFAFYQGNAVEIIPTLIEVPDVIYFDPMYGENKNAKAAPKGEIQVFRELVGEDQDAVTNATLLKNLSGKRFVIKRSLKADPLLSGVSMSFSGKSTRYDVYLK
jgi:16S rRNA (guanine1516-N2)-methyltransferase